MTDRADFHALEVLTRSGESRDACCALLEPRDLDDLDARLVSDVLRVSGQVGATLDTRRALVELCAIVRSIDAFETGRIELAELRAGLALQAARTDRFDDFHEARVLLRTLGEVLDHARDDATTRAARVQVAMLHRELREWLIEQLVGSPAGFAHAPANTGESTPPIDAFRVDDPQRRAAHDALAHELLHGAQGHPVTGLLGAAWVRGWSAVPIAGEMLGDDREELARLASAIGSLESMPAEVLLVTRRRSPAWRVVGDRIVVGDRRRASWSLTPDHAGLRLAAQPRAWWGVLTTPDLDFAYVEGAGHHALLGPSAFVERACGMPPLEAMASFRDHVEDLAVDGEPPPELLEVATSFGRFRRRSR